MIHWSLLNVVTCQKILIWKIIPYGKIVYNVCQQKAETNHTQLTSGENNTVTSIDCGAPVANLLTVTLLLDGVISTVGAAFLGLDLKDFYLKIPMDRPELLRMDLKSFPDNMIKKYNFMDKVDAKGFVILQVERGMYYRLYTGIIV